MLMTGAGNLMTIFLGLELLSLGLYCLCAISARATARESALKYLILSSMASGFLLFGMALLFGASGSVALAALAVAKPSLLLFLGSGSVPGRHRVQAEPRAVPRVDARRVSKARRSRSPRSCRS